MSTTGKRSRYTLRGVTGRGTQQRRARDMCPDDNYLGCQQASHINRMLESRSACIWHFAVTRFGAERVFSYMMTVPIVCSFIDSKSERTKIIENTVFVSLHDNPTMQSRIKSFLQDMIECNERWNRKMDKNIYDRVKKRLKVKMTYDNDLYETLITDLFFIVDILGVIGKDNYVSREDSMLEGGRVKKVNVKLDKKCSNRSVNNCERDGDCAIRISSQGKSQCVNQQRLRTVDPDGENPYYLQEIFTGTFVYTPICRMSTIGDSGVFNKNKVVGGKVQSKRKGVVCTFPPLGAQKPGWSGNLDVFRTFYSQAYLMGVPTFDGKQVSIHQGFLNHIMKWYNECIEGTVDVNESIELVGVSLGGGLANVAAFVLMQAGYKNVHLYAFGSPRVGDARLAKWMGKRLGKELGSDSGNYVRMNNVFKQGVFYTEFDPVCKFPPNTWSFLGSESAHLRFADNGLMRVMGSGPVVFRPVFQTYSTQPEYDASGTYRSFMNVFGDDPTVPITLSSNLAMFVHSVPAYTADIFQGALVYTTDDDQPKYTDYFDRIINLDKEEN